MNVSLTDDLRGLLRVKVESGQFPNEEAVIEEALRLFLIEKPHRASETSGPETERLPGPFLEDAAGPAPGDIPRSGHEIACVYFHDVTRQPDLFPGD